MSERIECPNCGSGDMFDLYKSSGCSVATCQECGTIDWGRNGSEPSVPRRSQPAEIMELPTCEGLWLYRRPDVEADDLRLVRVYPWKGGDQLAWGGELCVRGQYVKFVPPILPPPKRDADVEDLQSWISTFTAMKERGECTFHADCAIKTFERVIERLRREGK